MSGPDFDPDRVLGLIESVQPLLDRADYHTGTCHWYDSDLKWYINAARDALNDLDPTGLITIAARRAALERPS